MTRLLTELEIENILDFVKPQEGIPLDTAMSVVNANKERYRSQLCTQMVYPEIISCLKDTMRKDYQNSLVQAGDSVGVIVAHSIGQKNTQTTLNSVDWVEKLLYTKDGNTVVEEIGQMIDRILGKNSDTITHIEENRTEYLSLPKGYMIPSCDENGNVDWYRIEAITRHLPVGKLVKVTTQSGRSVTATQSKSFLVWNGEKFEAVLGADIKEGDIIPTTSKLNKPSIELTYFDMESIFPKNKYLYIHTSNSFVLHIPSKIPLDNDFGFFVGLYLAEGWCTKTFVGISNNDPIIRKRITDYCDRYGVTYNLVNSKAKNVRQGESNDLKINSTLLARMFMLICNTGSSNKCIPEFVYTAPNEFIKGLIDGYISGDGCAQLDGSITVSSVSENLIIGISFLLSYYDIFGVIRSHNVGSLNIKKAYILRISNGYAQNFARKIQLTASNKQDRLNNITLVKNYKYDKGRTQKLFPERDVHFDKVKSVEYVDGTTDYVYDLTVEVTRNFQLWNGVNIVDKMCQQQVAAL